MLRTGESVAKENGITKDTPANELLNLMIEYPQLLQRPIVEVGDEAVLARPFEKAFELVNRT